MAITYPRDLPIVPYVKAPFRLQRSDVMAEHGSGSVQVGELFSPRWRMDFTSKPLKASLFDMMEAWHLSLKGGQKRFLGYDVRRCRPWAYLAGLPALRHDSTPFDGTALIGEDAESGDEVSIKSLPANYQFSEGDYIGWMHDGRRALHKVVQVVMGNSSGVAAAVVIEPRIIIPASEDDVVTLVQPKCLMALIPGSWDGEKEGTLNPVSFSAIQVLA